MNPYGIDNSESATLAPLISLKVLYGQLPATRGCENCSSVNGADNKDWCCRTQSPSMYYSEFLRVFYVFQKWNKKKKTEFILRAISNYLSNDANKGCVFYKDGCQVYDERPLTCRTYGIVSKENWDLRWSQLKERLGSEFSARPQCSLVEADSYPTPELEDKWFNHTKECELRLKIPNHIVKLHDGDGGSYRTFHDHLLIELFDDSVLNHLSRIRMSNPSEEEIKLTVESIQELIDEKAIQSTM